MADFNFCMVCVDWEWSIEETAARLMEVSGKAQEKRHGPPYALANAQNAARAVERNRNRGRA